MIKKRLIRLMGRSGIYIVRNVLWQWLGLWMSILIMLAAGALFQRLCESLESGSLELLSPGMLGGFAAGILIAAGVRAFASRRASRASYLAGARVKKNLRELLYRKLVSFGPAYYEKVPTAQVVQVAVEGVEQLEVYFGQYLPQLFYSLLAPLTLFAVLSRISLRASAVLLVCVPLIPLTIMAVQKLAKRLLNRYWSVYTGLGDSFLENLQGLTTLKIYEADALKAEEMDREAEEFRRITMKVLMMQLNSIIVMDVVAYGGAAVGMLLAVQEYVNGAVSFGGALTIILLSSEFFIPMRLLGSFFHIAMNGMAASDKLFGILDLPAEAEGTACISHTGGTDKEQSAPALSISLRDVTFSYDGKRQVLCGISMELPARGMVSLVGLSGCGKSTIASLLTGRKKGYGGEILVSAVGESAGGTAAADAAGETAAAQKQSWELSELSGRSLMEQVTLVSHDSYLFKGTVEENLRLAAPQASEEELLKVLQEVNLLDFLESRQGLSTELSERGSNLSGGQRQRLALARALLHDTPVYIFDEATSNIDAESEAQIMAVVERLAERRSVLLISHRLANVVHSSEICVLKKGRIAERGTHQELLRAGGVYAALYEEQHRLETYAEQAAAENGCREEEAGQYRYA
ncbi:MAG: ABC transporter ATP-binding protein/permease [Eubacteriales bacterium]|nr:ABC transporter ATP-binding protein/permease [Eubacteriales bacterium]